MAPEQRAAAEDAASANRTTATVAWATAAFAFSVGTMRWISPDGVALDGLLGLAVGGGAAYLAVALNRIPQAVESATRIAFAAGVANGVMLPLAIAACYSGLPRTTLAGAWASLSAGDTGWALAAAIGFSVALSALVTPWAIYRTLRHRTVRRWFSGIAIERTVQAGIWTKGR